MANEFTNAFASDVGINEVTIFTATNKCILIGCNIANKTGSVLPISVYLENTGGDVSYIVKDVRVTNGENFEAIQGGKLVLLPGDQLKAITVEADAFDLIASLLTGVN